MRITRKYHERHGDYDIYGETHFATLRAYLSYQIFHYSKEVQSWFCRHNWTDFGGWRMCDKCLKMENTN